MLGEILSAVENVMKRNRLKREAKEIYANYLYKGYHSCYEAMKDGYCVDFWPTISEREFVENYISEHTNE